MAKKKKQAYEVLTGDADMYFQFGRTYPRRMVEAAFNEKYPNREIFPGLVLNENGEQLRPMLKLVFEPLEERSKND